MTAFKATVCVMICLAALGCAHTTERRKTMAMPTGQENWPSKADVIEGETLPADTQLVTMEFGDLGVEDVSNPDPDKPFGKVTVETKEDDQGEYALISFTPDPKAEKWVAARVEIPQVVFPNGAEWVQLEVWNDGTPVRIVADGVERDVPCFEVSFSENDEVWKGWQTRRAQLRAGQFSMWKEDKVRKIHNPFRLKYLLIIMRQGLPWQIGLRQMTFRLGRDS